MSVFLGILVSIVLWLLAITGGLIVLLLVVPFEIGGKGWLNGLAGGGEAGFVWGFGFLSMRVASEGDVELRIVGLRVYSTTVAELRERQESPEKAEKKAAKKAKKAARRDAKKQRKGGFRLSHVRPLLGVVVRVLKSVRLRGWIAGMVGTGDPAETAAVAALLEQLNGQGGEFELMISPNWVDEVLDVQGDVRLGFWLPRMAQVAILILLDRESRTVLRSIA